jgi:hypothetical protein
MAISITKPTVGGNEDTWGSTINTALDTIVDAVNGTSGTTAPNLTEGSWQIGGTAITTSAADLNIIDGLADENVDVTELGYLDGVTSDIQTQLDGKLSLSGGTFNDNVQLKFGTGDDAEIFHNGSHLIVTMNNDDNILIKDGNDSNTTRFTFTTTSGNFTATGNITAYSDAALKSDITTIDNALEKVANMRGVFFNKDGERGTGVVAQEVQKVIPEAVFEGGEYLSVAYGNLVGVLVEAIKDLKTQVEELKNGSTN